MIQTTAEDTTSNSAAQELIGFPELFERQVVKTPESTAIFFEDSVLSYRQLNAFANQIARYLIDQCNVSPEQCIGICLDKSAEAIATMLGILKAGAAFVPLDPEYPTDRLAFMIQDANIEHIICGDEYRRLFESERHCGLVQAGEIFDASVDDTPNVNHEIGSADLAYVMYTSGSTGKPKGVQIEHSALAAYCFADIEIYRVRPSDRTLQFSTLNFDIAIEEIFPPLLTGSSIVVRPRERAADRNELTSIVDQFGVTAIHLATAYWHEWVDLMHVADQRVPQSIRLMVVTGEKVSAEHYRRWKSLCDHDLLWCNAYGPTEATVTSTVFIPHSHWDDSNMPIGKPLKRYTAHILKEDLSEVSAGETGELFIGGPALARGYLNRQDLTSRAFVEIDIASQTHRLYKTGDLARWLPNGDIEFAGRIDHQIKLGSYRIEPGEIEAAINQFPSVSESLVSHEEINGKKFLIAFVATGGSKLGPEELAAFLKKRLPAYMVPTRYVLLDAFPKTINGKIDRDGLPAAGTGVVARPRDYVAPRTKLESDLAAIYADILNVPQIGIHDDFFSLGGSSLLVTRVITRIAGHLETEIPVRDFFANPTIASIAHQIERLNSNHTPTNLEATDSDDTSRRIRESLPTVNPLYFESGDNHLLGIHYEPVGADVSHAIVLCPSIGHEYARAHRNLQQLAVLLARNGHHVLRFDYAATGNSSGCPKSITASDWLGDISESVRTIRRAAATARVSVVGVRFGATLAANAKLHEDTSLILWDPVPNGNHFCESLESLHEKTLVDLSRYPVRRQPTHQEQAYGMDLPGCLRDSLANVSLQQSTQRNRVDIVVTNENRLGEYADEWRAHEASDDIFWDRPDFTESAFSSPCTFNTILSILRETQQS